MSTRICTGSGLSIARYTSLEEAVHLGRAATRAAVETEEVSCSSAKVSASE